MDLRKEVHASKELDYKFNPGWYRAVWKISRPHLRPHAYIPRDEDVARLRSYIVRNSVPHSCILYEDERVAPFKMLLRDLK